MTWTHLDIKPTRTMNPFEFTSAPFPTEQPVPQVWLTGDDLCWSPGGTKPSPSFRRILYEFTNLDRPDAVLAFAKKYGPLGLCEHGWPAMTHKRNRVLCPPKHRQKRARLEIRERVSHVLTWAHQGAALLRVAAKAQSGEPITGADWLDAGLAGSRHISLPSGESGELALPTGGLQAKQMIAGLATFWLRLGDPRPCVLPNALGRLELKFISGDQSINNEVPKSLDTAAAQLANNLSFAVLSIQLASAVCGEGLATCSGCGALYVPARTPIDGRRHFCPQCGARAAWRLSKRDKRMKQSRTPKRDSKIVPA